MWPRGLEHRPRCWEPRHVEQVVNFGFPGPSPGLRESQEALESGNWQQGGAFTERNLDWALENAQAPKEGCMMEKNDR